MCCGRSDGSPRPASTYYNYAIVDAAGNEVGEHLTTFIEASARLKQLGAGHKIKTRADATTV